MDYILLSYPRNALKSAVDSCPAFARSIFERERERERTKGVGGGRARARNRDRQTQKGDSRGWAGGRSQPEVNPKPYGGSAGVQQTRSHLMTSPCGESAEPPAEPPGRSL